VWTVEDACPYMRHAGACRSRLPAATLRFGRGSAIADLAATRFACRSRLLRNLAGAGGASPSPTNASLFLASFFKNFIKFRKTKQIVIAFVTAARKAMLSAAKTNRRLSGRKLHARDVYHLFFNVFLSVFLSVHTPILPQHNKKVRSRSRAPKTANSDCCYTN